MWEWAWERWLSVGVLRDSDASADSVFAGEQRPETQSVRRGAPRAAADLRLRQAASPAQPSKAR